MKKQELVITNNQCFTLEQAEQHIKGKVSLINWEILIAHITVPELAIGIEGFTEQNGVLFL